MNQEVVANIVKATGVKKGELILLQFWGEDEDRKLLHPFEVEMARMGATPFVLQQARSVNKEIFKVCDSECFGDKFFSIFSQVDAVVDIFAYPPGILGCRLEDAAMDNYRKYLSRVFGTLMNKVRFTQIRLATEANAEESGLEAEEFIGRMNTAYDIDYEQMKKDCESRIEELKKTTVTEIYTGVDHCLTVYYEGREWFGDFGDGDLPCGEVYVAPIEEKTEGSLYYDTLHFEDIGKLTDVVLEVKEGKVVHSNKEEINAFLKELPEGGAVVCELGFGLNKQVHDLCGYTVLDEKMADTFHIAIGANTMFGGKNEAPLHIDLVGAGTVKSR